MLFLSRFTVRLCTLCVLFLGLYPASEALAWTLRFAPLDPSRDDTFAPSTSLPVAPQFFRISVIPNQITIGAEEPYIRSIHLNPPIRFKSFSPDAEQPVAKARRARPRHLQQLLTAGIPRQKVLDKICE